MAEWVMAYPYLTFFLVVLIILAIDNAISNITKHKDKDNNNG